MKEDHCMRIKEGFQGKKVLSTLVAASMAFSLFLLPVHPKENQHSLVGSQVVEATRTLKPSDEGNVQPATSEAFLKILPIETAVVNANGRAVLRFKVTNETTTVQSNVIVRPVTIPDGTVILGYDHTIALGDIRAKDEQNTYYKEFSLDLLIPKSVASGDYPVTFNLKSNENPGEEGQGLNYVVYVRVKREGETEESYTWSTDFKVRNVEIPEKVQVGEIFSLNFNVMSLGASAEKVKVNVELPEGIINMSQSSFVVPMLIYGFSQDFSVKLKATEGIVEKFHSIKITVEGAAIGEKESANKDGSQTGEEEVRVVTGTPTEYLTGVFVQSGNGSSSGVKKPLLLLSDYKFYRTEEGIKTYIDEVKKANEKKNLSLTATQNDHSQPEDTKTSDQMEDMSSTQAFAIEQAETEAKMPLEEIYAGDHVVLHLKLRNTSPTAMSNIKVSFKSDVIVPAEGSNSFFIPSLASGQVTEEALVLAVLPNAEAGPRSLAFDMYYEFNGGEAQNTEEISVIVEQKVRYELNELNPLPLSVQEGQVLSLSYQVRNLGQSTLRNVQAKIEGNVIPSDGNTSLFLGNIEAAKEENIDLPFFFQGTGEQQVRFIFSYETDAGVVKEQIEDFHVQVEAYEAPPQTEDDGEIEVDQPEDTSMWSILMYAVLALIVCAIILVFVINKKRKQKKSKSLEMDD